MQHRRVYGDACSQRSLFRFLRLTHGRSDGTPDRGPDGPTYDGTRDGPRRRPLLDGLAARVKAHETHT